LDWAVGPLISWTRDALPDWLSLWEEDYEAIQSHIVQQIEAVVGHFRGRARFWHVVHRINTATGLSINEQQRLELAAAAIDAARNQDRQTPVMVSFELPWYEYLAQHRHEATPLDYAEALVRAKLGLGMIGLEINLGFWPGGTGRRTTLEVQRLLHWWSRLGLPLVIIFSAPSDTSRDERARSAVQPISLGADQPNPQTQADLAEQWYTAALMHESVMGLIWKQLTDQQPHELPHAGLLDKSGQPKPVCRSIQALCSWYGRP
jgi:hypothetical protein